MIKRLMILLAVLCALPVFAARYYYDEAGRLNRAVIGEKQIVYRYDEAGNLLEKRIEPRQDAIFGVAPDSHDFGLVNVNTVSMIQGLTLSNTGEADLHVDDISLSGNDPMFGVNAGSCDGLTPIVPPQDSCTLYLSFAPTAEGAQSADLSIATNDPNTPSTVIPLTGTAITTAENEPPTAPQLVAPQDNASGLDTSVTFEWRAASDPDGDPISYDVVYCEQADFTGCLPVDVASVAPDGRLFAVNIAGGGLLVLGVAAMGGAGNWRRLKLAAAIAVTTAGLISCGGGAGGSDDNGNGNGAETLSYTASGLTGGATYHWMVIADDGAGGRTGSDVRTLTTQ